MVLLSQTLISFVVDWSQGEPIVTRKFLKLLSFFVWIATLQGNVAVFRTLNAVVCVINAYQVTILIVFDAKISIASAAIANVQLVASITAATVATTFIPG